MQRFGKPKAGLTAQLQHRTSSASTLHLHSDVPFFFLFKPNPLCYNLAHSSLLQPPAFGCPNRFLASHSLPKAARVIFYQESIVLASVVQTALQRVCCQSWAALINLVCEAVFSALVNVHYYLPESLL